MKWLSTSAFVFLFGIVQLLLSPFPTSAAGLVPCGTAEHPEACTLCHILLGGQNIITWGMGIMVVVGLALIMIAGVIYIVSVGDNGRMTTAKGIIEKALGGLALILCGWLIVNTIIGVLANDTMGIGIQKTNWHTFRCDSQSSANTGVDTGGVPKAATGTTARPEALVLQIPSSSVVETRMPSGTSKHITLSGNPDFSRGPIVVENVVSIAVVPYESMFLPVAAASATGMTITPATISTMEEWRNGLTLTVEAGVAEKNVYTVTLKQGGSVLGSIKVNIGARVATTANRNNSASMVSPGTVPPDDTAHAVAPSGPRDSSDSFLSGRVVDMEGHPLSTTLYCGDIRQDYFAAYQTSANDGSVSIPKDTCNNNGGKVWVNCPDEMASSPTEMTVNQFNGGTFTCTISAPRGGVSSGVNTVVTTVVSGFVRDSDGKPVQATVYCGSKGSEGVPLIYRTNADGSVTVSQKDCDAKVPGGVASVWVACPYNIASVPTEIPVSQFSGSTFICVIPGTAGSIQYMQGR